MAVLAFHQSFEFEFSRRSKNCVLEFHPYASFNIRAACRTARFITSSASAEKSFENISESASAEIKFYSREIESASTSRAASAKIRSCRAKLIVLLSFLFVAEYLVCSRNFFEFSLSFFFVALRLIGMIFSRGRKVETFGG